MFVKLFRALAMISKFCVEQPDCKKCPIKEIYGKVPSEWF